MKINNDIADWDRDFDPLDYKDEFFVWHKTNPTPKFKKAGFLNKGHTWNFGEQNKMHNFFESPICMRPERLQNPKQ